MDVEIRERMQEIVDAMKQMPAYAQYVQQRKLHLIDSNLEVVDELLESGVLK